MSGWLVNNHPARKNRRMASENEELAGYMWPMARGSRGWLVKCSLAAAGVAAAAGLKRRRLKISKPAKQPIMASGVAAYGGVKQLQRHGGMKRKLAATSSGGVA